MEIFASIYEEFFSDPRYNFLGVMSTIGGSLGLYLGFSLLDSYRVIGSFCQVLANWRELRSNSMLVPLDCKSSLSTKNKDGKKIDYNRA